MKKVIAVFLMIFAFTVASVAQNHAHMTKQERAALKQQKKQQKAMRKYTKSQQKKANKAIKKAYKQSKKSTKYPKPF